MLQSIEEQAEVCVARGCGFALLGILTFMLGLSWDMSLACRVGGLLTLTATAILLLKALRAFRRPVQRTELWMTLGPELRPSAAVAQRLLGQILHTCYLRFATHVAALSVALLALSLGFQALDFPRVEFLVHADEPQMRR
jgi:hypothetical protein